MPTDTTPPSPDALTPAEQRIIEEGKAEWKKKRSGADWEGWLKIGRTLDMGRSVVMRELHTNRPLGRTYNEAFSRWLRLNELDTIDKVLRAALLECMANLPAITAWRDTLAASQRMEWNHPRVVLRHWQTSLRPAPQVSKVAKAASQEIAWQNLAQQVEEWKHRAERAEAKLDGTGDLVSPRDTADQIGAAIDDWLRTVSDTKFDESLFAAKAARKKRTAAARKKGR